MGKLAHDFHTLKPPVDFLSRGQPFFFSTKAQKHKGTIQLKEM
jgi:hypothetical protein